MNIYIFSFKYIIDFFSFNYAGRSFTNKILRKCACQNALILLTINFLFFLKLNERQLTCFLTSGKVTESITLGQSSMLPQYITGPAQPSLTLGRTQARGGHLPDSFPVALCFCGIGKHSFGVEPWCLMSWQPVPRQASVMTQYRCEKFRYH